MNEWSVCLRAGARRGERQTLKELIHWLFLRLVEEVAGCHAWGILLALPLPILFFSVSFLIRSLP